MKTIKKFQNLINGGVSSTYCLFGVQFFCVLKTIKAVSLYVMGKRVFRSKRKLNNKNSLKNLLKVLQERGNYVGLVWLDHSLGGGTELYTQRQCEDIRRRESILKIQYIPKRELYAVSLIDKMDVDFYFLKSVEELEVVLRKLFLREVVVNNLVGYKDVLLVLLMIKRLRSKKAFRVRFNLHDYYSVCPNFNLMYKGEKYCELNPSCCEKCLYLFKKSSLVDSCLLAEIASLAEWRKSWLTFFGETCDQIFVFSNAAKQIFLNTYQDLEEKICLAPHSVPYLRSAKIKRHNGLNIAFLGSILSKAKGAAIVKEIVLSNLKEEIRFFVIGEFLDPPEKLIVLGRYEVEQLPDIVEEKMIDLIIIPSICPETFSYTTSEAIQLGVPVACFDLGAQVDKVRLLKEKIIFSSMDPNLILMEITEYFLKKRVEGTSVPKLG